MLRFFRYNDPYRLLVVLLILFIAGLTFYTFSQQLTSPELKSMVVGEALNDGKAMYVEIVDHTAPIHAWFSEFTDTLFGRGLVGRHVVAILLIFFSAAYFAILLINNKAYNENTYLPALVFAVLCCCSFDFFHLSAPLLASILLLFALNNIFREIEFRVQRDETLLNLGIYIGMASLLVFTYFIFLIGTIVQLAVYTRISLRKVFLILVGFLLPHACLIMYYWYGDHTLVFFERFYLANIMLSNHSLISWPSLGMLGLVPLVYFGFSLFMVNREARFTKYQSQLLQVMFGWLIVGLIEIAFTRERTPHSFITIVPSLTYFISHHLLLIRRKRIAEVTLWLFIVGIFVTGTLAKEGRIKAIDYSKMRVAGSPGSISEKRVMTLEDDLPLYVNNKMAGFFLNAELSRSILTNPGYFENVVMINNCFEKDAPEIIIDKNDWLKPFLNRLPKWKKEYVREGIYYKRIAK